MNSFGAFHHTCKSRPHLATRQCYERPDAQVLDTLFDLFLSAEQCFRRDLQQLASVVSDLLHNAHLQIRRRLETGMLESASAVSATAVLDPSKDLKDRSWVWQMIVYQNQSMSVVGVLIHSMQPTVGYLPTRTGGALCGTKPGNGYMTTRSCCGSHRTSCNWQRPSPMLPMV